jgi:hypothetical protein
MELTFVFVVVAIIFVFYLAAYKQEMESYQNEEYSTEDYNNIDLALNKVLEKGDPIANAVEPRDEMSCFTHDAEFHELAPLKEFDTTSTKNENQYMFGDDSSLVSYNETYYHDWRFPAKPIEVEFAANPEEYVKKYPKRYPSYVYKTKDELIM